MTGPGLSPRTAAAARAASALNALSRRARRGQGSVVGGRLALALDPHLVTHLARGRPVALVSGTNGKTTTSALLAAALESSAGAVVSNVTGANMPAGHAAALAEAAVAGRHGAPVVLEVDEAYLPATLTATAARAVVLLNLSRDQLDRTNEVRMTATRWRQALAGVSAMVVANADDPLVAWAAASAPAVRWVAAGSRWRGDASGCPACQGRLAFEEDGRWWCRCGFSRPAVDMVVEEVAGSVVAAFADGRRLDVDLSVPGRFNRANAVMAAAAAAALGVDEASALGSMKAVTEVAGRFALVEVGGVTVRLLLAKNPAGWAELLDLVDGDRRPLVVGINARVADGRDPSWLWDVPFERLGDRAFVVATGERRLDLAVRLRYAEVPHRLEADPAAAVAQAAEGSPSGTPVDVIGNYTVFSDLWRGG